MKKNLYLLLFSFPILIFLVQISAPKMNAATLGRTYDRLSTSRPSASAPLASDQAAAADQVVITDLNDNVMFLASDSAVLAISTGETLNTVTIASASAADTPSANQRTLFFTGPAANTHHAGNAIFAAVSATHEISFNVITEIPASGDIEIYFPELTTGDNTNSASPSASTFQFNGLSATEVKVSDDGGAALTLGGVTLSTPTAGSRQRITIDIGSTAIAAGSNVKIFLGCTALSSGNCSTYSPRIINPTQSSVANGTGRIWEMEIVTEDASNVQIDTSKIKIGTVDAVYVQGIVDPTLTVTIAGVNTATDISGTSGCASETTNSGINSTATNVNLGNINAGINIAAQTITVSTNAKFGYTITSTSSGRLIDPTSGFFIPDVNDKAAGLTANDTPAPAVMTAGVSAFGLFPCGNRVPTSSPDYDDENTIASSAKGTNPWNTGVNGYYATIASYTDVATNDVTALRYAVTAAATTPAGLYKTIFTYVVAPSF